MPPSGIVSADLTLDKLYYFAVDDSHIWRAVSFGGGNAVWTSMQGVSNIPTAGGRFLAVCCSPLNAGIIYALAVDGSGVTYCGRSSTFGTTWVWTEVTTQTGKEYTASYQVSSTYTHTGYNQNANLACTHPKPSGAQCIAIAGRYHATPTAGGAWYSMSAEDATTIPSAGCELWTYDDTIPHTAAFRALGFGAAADAALNDYFGAGNYNIWLRAGTNDDFPMPNEEARVRTVFYQGHGFAGLSCWAEEWAFFDYPSYPRALSCGYTNDNYVYVGTQEGIFKSIDGGFTWETLTGSFGANDLRVDNPANGVVRFWATDGKLGYFQDDDLFYIDSVTETPDMNANRIAQYGTFLWVCTGTTVKRRYVGSWTTQLTGLLQPQGIKVYNNGATVVCVDTTGFWYSADYGVTWTNKKGSHATAGSHTIHLLT
jgi:hypothetical protein